VRLTVNAIPGAAPTAATPEAGNALAALVASLLPAGSLRRRVASGAAWSVLGSGVSQGMALVAAALAARALGAGDYGSLIVAVGTCTLLAEVAGAGLAVAATRHVAETRNSDPERAGRLAGGAVSLAAAAGLLLAALQFLLAPWVAGSLLAAPGLAPLLRAGAPLTFAASVCAAQSGALAGLEAFRGLAGAAAVRGAVTLAAVVPGALLAGTQGALAGTLAASIACAVAQHRALRGEAERRSIPLGFAPRPADLRELAHVGVPAVAASLALTVATWASTALLARSSLAEAGVLGVARQWQAVVLFLASAVAGLGLPLVASALPSRDLGGLRRALGASFAASTGLALLVAIPVAALAPWLLAASGPAFAGRGPVLVLCCGAAVLLAANMAVGQAIWALGAHRAGVALAALRGALLVILTAALAPRGAGGVALAWFLTAAILTAVQAPFVAWVLSRKRAEWGSP
jgi:O-antigen/teichoic acid export membrane protein